MLPDYTSFKWCVTKDRAVCYGKCFDTEEEAEEFLRKIKEMDMQSSLLSFLGRNPDGSKIERGVS